MDSRIEFATGPIDSSSIDSRGDMIHCLACVESSKIILSSIVDSKGMVNLFFCKRDLSHVWKLNLKIQSEEWLVITYLMDFE